MTTSGKSCSAWSIFGEDGRRNYCRNRNNRFQMPWCFTVPDAFVKKLPEKMAEINKMYNMGFDHKKMALALRNGISQIWQFLFCYNF